MDYYKYQFLTHTADNEILLALVSTLPFDTFVENEKGFDGYLPCGNFGPSVDEQIDALMPNFHFTYKKELIKGENWNEVWESNFHPVRVGSFCGIRAGFHAPIADVEHELIITPKMAFGTGHHETTHMMVQLMEDIPFIEQKVLDYGCGTGVLAILASKLGAAAIDAIDIEQAAWQNTLENCETNGVKNVNAQKGGLDTVQSNRYGIVLANINRNVILKSLHPLSNMINPNGILVLSGILKADAAILQKALREHGFKEEKTLERNGWQAIQLAVISRQSTVRSPQLNRHLVNPEIL